jgi:hypothetical protein
MQQDWPYLALLLLPLLLRRAGYTRLLYRMSMDFLGWARYVPGIQKVWKGVAGQVGGREHWLPWM